MRKMLEITHTTPVVLEDLADPTRRRAVRDLAENPVSSLHDMSGSIAQESDIESPEGVSHRLHHVHLPKLAASGLITYNADTHTATLLEEADVQLAERLEAVSSRSEWTNE